ncbi:MAG: cysteine--tRNA ligase [Candidatus Curtissbacteria bacterium]
MKLYNFLSRKAEEFEPITPGRVGMYTCGPTVYDYVHIGNWRTFVFEDVLKRALQFVGYEVNHVMNITDIDDKIIKKAGEEKVEIGQLTKKYEEAFSADLEKLNIIPADHYPKATDHIEHMVSLIQKLLDRGIAYKAEDGIYFSVEKFPNYGRLSGLEKRELKKGARVNDDQYDKENWSDFALWKFPPSPKASTDAKAMADKSEGQEKKEPSWPAPFGEGRPGWHIECSEMSTDVLGDHFDIHCGGIDLLFPHHENEIAQSEAATGGKFVNSWLEGEHLLVDGQKMSKSLGNIFTLEDIVKKGFEPLALRYLFLTAHYRSKLNFTWESLTAAQNALSNLRQEIASWDETEVGLKDFEKDFKNATANDLDMPRAIATMWEMVKSNNPTGAKRQSILLMDKVLGLGLGEIKKAELPDGARELMEKREEVRNAGNFEESDKLRDQLKEMGVEIEDTNGKTKWKVKN